MRLKHWTVALGAAACMAGASLASAAATTMQDETRQKSKHEQKMDAKADRRDGKTAKRELDAAAGILDQISEQRLAGVSRDRLSQIKTSFRDLYNDYDATGGRAANREGRGMNQGTSPRGDWQSDYANLRQQLDDLGVRSEAGRSEDSGRATGTSGDDRDRRLREGADLNQLAKFRARLDAFYQAASPNGGRDSRRHKR